jgi:hypothetical protein
MSFPLLQKNARNRKNAKPCIFDKDVDFSEPCAAPSQEMGLNICTLMQITLLMRYYGML